MDSLTPSGGLAEIEVTVLGRFGVLVDGREVMLPSHARRLLAYLCISHHRAAMSRTRVAEDLWPGSAVTRAQSSLRTALWRVRRADPRIVRALADTVQLGPAVQIDLTRSVEQAERLLADPGTLLAVDAQVGSLMEDLLPGWEEDWLLLERERMRQLRIHALEALARRLCGQGRYAQAIDAALAAVAAEPLRESAQSALIAAYRAEGNVVEAQRQYRSFATLLWRELQVHPSRSLQQQLTLP